MEKKEIKTTSELGIMLDTERPWISIEDRLPSVLNDAHSDRNVQVMLKNGRVTKGWCGMRNRCWYVADGDEYWLDWEFPHPNNPVVAWRELVTDNK